MNEVKLKKDLEKKLRDRGMKITIHGDVIEPPQRMFKNLGEEVLWILNESKIRLSTNLPNRKLEMVQKEKIGSRCFYTANFQDTINIPTAYKLIRQTATQKIRQEIE